MKKKNSGVLRLIAIFKFLKVITLIALGIAALKLIHKDAADTLIHVITRLGLDPDSHFFELGLSKVASLPPQRFRELGIGSFIYAALFLTEGTGLWLGKPWAEWFTTIITGSLLPVETYELVRHPTAGKAVVLVLNIAIVIYLILRIRKERSEAR